MKKLFFLILLLGLSFILFFIFSSQTPKTITILIDKNFKGDENQLLGINDALIINKNFPLTINVLTYDNSSSILETAKKYPGNSILIAGISGLNFLKTWSIDDKKKAQIKIIWTGHMYFNELNEMIDLIDLIFLPESVISHQQARDLANKTKLILLSGVPHRLNEQFIAETTAKFNQKHPNLLPEPSSQNIAVILPGDAPDEEGQILFFTPSDAKKLASDIFKIEGPDKFYLITNGPRTGSYNYETLQKLDPNPHRTNQLDKVTIAFLEELKNLGATKIQSFNFQFDDQPSAYIPLLGLVRTTGRLHVPGESTSMISEASDIVDDIVVDWVLSMNKSHVQFVRNLFEKGRVSLLESGKLSKPPQPMTGKTLPAQIASKAIIELIEEDKK